jgi:lipid-binding SYLF domain-containing protein
MKTHVYGLVMVAALMLAAGCSTAPQTEEKREALRSEADAAVDAMTRTDPGLRDFINRGTGYAIFPSVGKGGVGVGGAYGRGIVYDDSGRMLGYADLTQASIGLQLGGQTFKELLVFENEAALNRFKNEGWSPTANASAVALKSGAAATARFQDGVAIFTQPNGGAMFEASVGGQQFKFINADDAENVNKEGGRNRQ